MHRDKSKSNIQSQNKNILSANALVAGPSTILQKKILNAYRRNNALQQFITSLNVEESSGEDEKYTAEAIDEIVANFVNMESNKDDWSSNGEQDTFITPFHNWAQRRCNLLRYRT